MNEWAGVILAAGNGERMKSRIPKVLHLICGKPMLRYPVDLLRGMGVERIVVVVSPSNRAAIEGLLGDSVDYALQPQPRGTADAVNCALPRLSDTSSQVLVQNGDTPLVQPDSIQLLTSRHLEQGNRMTMLTAEGVFIQDVGRVIRDSQGQVTQIIEAQDLTDLEDPPAEINAGAYCFQLDWLRQNLPGLPPSPNGEKYLTALASLGNTGALIDGVPLLDPSDAFGVNNRVQMAIAESVQRERIRERWMLAGVTIPDPGSAFIDAEVVIGQDTTILPNTMVQGQTVIGEDCVIGPNSVIQDSNIGDRCRVTASVVEESQVAAGVQIGPFSHLRTGASLGEDVYIGNYVEVKNSRLEHGAVSGHFSYLGDAFIGSRVNIGAGTITCNYDGVDKHTTTIGDDAFIGCDTMLVAPVTVGDGAATGAGAVVTKDIPAGLLAVGVPAKIVESKAKSN